MHTLKVFSRSSRAWDTVIELDGAKLTGVRLLRIDLEVGVVNRAYIELLISDVNVELYDCEVVKEETKT